MAKLTLQNILSGFGLLTRYNANNDAIEAALENTVSRDGTSPNTMEADLDMNDNHILNLPNGATNGEPVTVGQLVALTTPGAVDHGALSGLGDNDHPQYARLASDETVAGAWTFPALTAASALITSANPSFVMIESDGAANNKRWAIEVQGEQLMARVQNDAVSVATNFLAVDRTGTTVDEIQLDATLFDFNGNMDLSGTFVASNVVSGTYSPTLSLVANLSAATLSGTATYMRVGNTVHVSGRCLVDAVSADTVTTLGITLPVASNFASVNSCFGTCVQLATSPTPDRFVSGEISGNSTTDVAEATWVAVDTAEQSMTFHFTYVVI